MDHVNYYISTPPTKSEKTSNFVNILRNSDYYNDSIQNKHLEWLFEAEDTAEFVDWFCNYIGPENILKEEEINEYLELAKCAGTSDIFPLNESEFHDTHPILEPVTHKTLISIEEEILEVDTFLSVLNTQYENLRCLEAPQEKELHELQEMYKSVQKHLQSTEHKCITLSKKLDLTHEKAMECYAAPMGTIFQNSFSGECADLQLLSHMPIKDLQAKFDRFQQQINLLTSRSPKQQFPWLEEEKLDMLQKHMSVFNTDTSSNNKMLKNSRTRAKYWKKAIFEAKYKSVMECLEKQENLATLKDILQLTKDIESGLFQPSQTKLRVQQVNLQDKIECFNQMSLGKDISITIEQFANAHVMQMFNKLSEKVKHLQNKTLECQQMLLQCTESQACHCCLIFLLLFDEKLKLEDITQLSQNFSEPLYEELKQLSIRREKMKIIRVVHDARDGKELCLDHSLPKMLLLLAPPKTSYQQLFDVFKKIDDAVHIGECELLNTSFQVMEETFHENIQSLQKLEKVLFTGTTKKPVVVDLELSCQLYDIEMVVKGLQEKLKKIIAECEATKEYISKKPSRNRRLLWVHFLTNYKKIVELVDGMEHKLLKLGKQYSKRF